jgi:hypothetical protein
MATGRAISPVMEESSARSSSIRSSRIAWEESLGRRGLVHGQFGENFTIEGLPDTEV